MPDSTAGPKISCIICAYNEEPRIASVLAIVEDHPLIHEVIVVDDGSLDKTAEIVSRHPRVHLISYKQNRGKSYAMTVGVSQASGDLLVFLDADLVGLNADDVSALIEPVRSGIAEVSISLRKNSLLIYKLLGLDFVSGERVFPAVFLLPHLTAIASLPGFGLEVYTNRIIIEQKLRVRVVPWNHVINIRKTTKIGFWRGWMSELSMIRHVLSVASVGEIISQNYWLLRLRTKTQ